MHVEIGNKHAIEGYREGDVDEVLYRSVEGERITTLRFPEGIGIEDAFRTTLVAMSHHIEAGEAPSWIESDSPGLTALLAEHYGIKNNVRPAAWGKKG